MLSEMSNEEVAQSQNEYLQLWEDGGGLNSLTPTDDWESRDPDTPDNELEDDSQRIKTGIKKTNKCKLTSPPPPPSPLSSSASSSPTPPPLSPSAPSSPPPPPLSSSASSSPQPPPSQYLPFYSVI